MRGKPCKPLSALARRSGQHAHQDPTKEIFSGSAEAPTTIATYSCQDGWVLGAKRPAEPPPKTMQRTCRASDDSPLQWTPDPPSCYDMCTDNPCDEGGEGRGSARPTRIRTSTRRLCRGLAAARRDSWTISAAGPTAARRASTSMSARTDPTAAAIEMRAVSTRRARSTATPVATCCAGNGQGSGTATADHGNPSKGQLLMCAATSPKPTGVLVLAAHGYSCSWQPRNVGAPDVYWASGCVHIGPGASGGHSGCVDTVQGASRRAIAARGGGAADARNQSTGQPRAAECRPGYCL